MQFIANDHPDIQSAINIHFRLWDNCRSCGLCQTRKRVVLWKGYLPAQFLLVGEAPFISEDLFGFPFSGAAGKELDNLLKFAAKDHNGELPSIAITNIVACITQDERKRPRPPTDTEIASCAPRILDFISISEVPTHNVIAMGETADKGLTAMEIPHETIVHPAHLLRISGTPEYPAVFMSTMRKLEGLFYGP